MSSTARAGRAFTKTIVECNFRLLYFSSFFVAPTPEKSEPDDIYFNGINLSSLERGKKPYIKMASAKNIRGLLPWEK